MVDRIEEPYYYLKNDKITKFTKEQISLIGYIYKNNKHMIKCKKCGSTNVKVDFSQVYTSIPAMYGYQCNECGEHGYVNCDEACIDNDDSNLDNENINTPKDEIKGGLTGWICPKCGRCYSPFTSMCSFCISDNGYWTNTITCSGTDGTNKY